MKYAVVKSGGKQYKVSEGDVIEVDRLPMQKDGKVSFKDVLLIVSDDGAVKIGKPTLEEKVMGTLVEDFKGEKIRVSKFKSKVRYRKTIGFRASLSRVKIDSIGTKTFKAVKEEKPKVTAKTAKK